MPKIKSLREARTVEVKFDSVDEQGRDVEEILHVTYSRGKYTPEYQRLQNEKLQDAPDEKKVLEMLLDIIESWDMIDEDDKPIPLTYEVLEKEIPLSVLYKISNAIAGDKSPNAPASETSGDTF